MADSVNRDVIINLKVVDHASSASSLKKLESKAEAAYKAQQDAYNKAQSSIDKASERAARNRIKLLGRIEKENARAAQAEVKASEKAAREKQKQDERVFRNRAKMLARIAKEEERQKSKAAQAEAQHAAKIDQFNNQRISSQKALGESVKAGLGGATQLAGGLLQLGIISEENLGKFVKQFAAIQAGVNVISGGITVAAALADGMKSYRDATLATAAAQKLLAATQIQGGAAGVADAASSTAGKVGSSAAAGAAGGAGVKGIAAAGAAGAKSLAVLAGKAAVLTIAADGLQAGLTGAANKIGLTTRESETMIGALLSWREASKNAAASTDALSKAEARREKLKAQQAANNQRIREQASFSSEVRASRNAISSRIDEASGASPSEQAEKSRLRALSELEKAEAEVAAARDRALQRQRDGQFALSADAIQASERLKAAVDSRADAEQKVLDLSKQRLETQKSMVAAAQSELKAANSKVAFEKDATSSKLERFANLGKGTQNKIKEISSRVAAGEKITGADADILEKAGFGGKLTKKFREQQGIAAGGKEALEGLGELDGEAAAIQERNKAIANLEKQQGAESEITGQIVEERKRYLESLKKLREATEKELQSKGDEKGVAVPQRGAGNTGVESEVASLSKAVTGAVRNATSDVRRTQERVAAMEPIV